MIERDHDIRRGAFQRTMQTDTEQRIHPDIGLRQSLVDDQRRHFAACLRVRVGGAPGGARFDFVAQTQHEDVAPGTARQLGQHVTVAAVVAGAADDADALRLRPAVQQQPPRAQAGAGHQIVLVQAEARHRHLLGGAHRGTAVELGHIVE